MNTWWRAVVVLGIGLVIYVAWTHQLPADQLRRSHKVVGIVLFAVWVAILSIAVWETWLEGNMR